MKLSTYLSALRKCEHEATYYAYCVNDDVDRNNFVGARLRLADKLERRILEREMQLEEYIQRIEAELSSIASEHAQMARMIP